MSEQRTVEIESAPDAHFPFEATRRAYQSGQRRFNRLMKRMSRPWAFDPGLRHYEKRTREQTKKHRKLALRRTHGGRLTKSRVTPPADFQHELAIMRKKIPTLPHCGPTRAF